MMMTDRDYELISAYIDGELSPEEASELTARLDADPALRAELDEARQWVAVMKTLPELTAPRNYTLTPAQAQTLRETTPHTGALPPNVTAFPSDGGRYRQRMLALVAAGAVLFVFVGALISQMNRPPDVTVGSVASAPTETTDSAADRTMMTPTVAILSTQALEIIPAVGQATLEESAPTDDEPVEQLEEAAPFALMAPPHDAADESEMSTEMADSAAFSTLTDALIDPDDYEFDFEEDLTFLDREGRGGGSDEMGGMGGFEGDLFNYEEHAEDLSARMIAPPVAINPQGTPAPALQPLPSWVSALADWLLWVLRLAF